MMLLVSSGAILHAAAEVPADLRRDVGGVQGEVDRVGIGHLDVVRVEEDLHRRHHGNLAAHAVDEDAGVDEFACHSSLLERKSITRLWRCLKFTAVSPKRNPAASSS